MCRPALRYRSCSPSCALGCDSFPQKSIACWIPRRDCAGRCCPVLAAGPAAEGGLDAECVLVVTDGTEELALGDGGVPAVGPVAVAPLELPHRVGGVAERIDETAGLVGLPRQEAGPALNPPGDLRHRLRCFEEQVRLPLDPQSSHLERARQHAKGAQREGVLLMEPEGAAEALPELPFGEPLVAGTEGEELLVGVRPEAPGGRAPRVEPAAAEYPGERRVGAQAPHEPHGVAAESETETRDHGRVDSLSGDRYAPTLNGASAEEVVEKDDGGSDRREVGEADQQECPQPPHGRGARRRQALPGHTLVADLERRCLYLLHADQYTHIPPLWMGEILLRAAPATRVPSAERWTPWDGCGLKRAVVPFPKYPTI